MSVLVIAAGVLFGACVAVILGLVCAGLILHATSEHRPPRG